MAQINLSDYKNLYLQTAKDYMNNISLACSKLSSNLADNEAINTIHIGSHSLKSQSQVMGFTDIADLCLSLEKTSNDILTGVSKADEMFLNFLKDFIEKAEKYWQLYNESLEKK